MSEESRSKKWIYFLVGSVCVVLVVVLVILFFLQGDTKITGEGDVSVVESITCEAEGLWYPYFSYDNSNSKSIKINALFDNRDKLDTISFVYRLGYDDSSMAEQSSASNHAAMAKWFEEDSLGVDSFEIRYSNMGDAMQMEMYAKAQEINGVTAKYFLLNGSNGSNRDALTKNYNDKGLNCVILNKQEKNKGGK